MEIRARLGHPFEAHQEACRSHRRPCPRHYRLEKYVLNTCVISLSVCCVCGSGTCSGWTSRMSRTTPTPPISARKNRHDRHHTTRRFADDATSASSQKMGGDRRVDSQPTILEPFCDRARQSYHQVAPRLQGRGCCIHLEGIICLKAGIYMLSRRRANRGSSLLKACKTTRVR